MKKIKHYLFPIFTLILVVIIWDSVVKIAHIDSWILPSPYRILIALWDSRQLLLRHSFITIFESLSGLVLAVIVAFIVSTAMFFFSTLKKSLYPLLIISQTIPFIALAPLLVVWFGFGFLPKILIVTLVCFFPIAVNLTDGFQSADPSIISSMKILGADRKQLFQFVILPTSLPFFFSGLRISGSYALLTAVVAEWIGSSSGLGVLLIRASKSYLTERVFATIFVISLISLISIVIIDKLYNRSKQWNGVNN
ncbi:hypothetical protein A3C23_03315 [Candidatus Roizmanbacteria bacterium RIFCSPHIGHO2_02_FULL_37_13b]|nr:MAG: hypothetical protein A3C23_03315 [Candidatus Roizmanbacteria bacterium RIFCSPHIGHO2_02_FULL_37_13b]